MGYLPECEQYNIILEYKPGATNWANQLSRRPDYKRKNLANEDVTVWPDHYFCNTHTSIRVFDMDSIGDNLDQKVKLAQYPNQSRLKEWASVHNVMVRSLCLSVVLVLEFSDRGISQIGSQPDVSIRKLS